MCMYVCVHMCVHASFFVNLHACYIHMELHVFISTVLLINCQCLPLLSLHLIYIQCCLAELHYGLELCLHTLDFLHYDTTVTLFNMQLTLYKVRFNIHISKIRYYTTYNTIVKHNQYYSVTVN